MHLLIGMAGIVLILCIAFALSSDRGAIRLRVVGAAFLLQAGIALLVLYIPAGRAVIASMSVVASTRTYFWSGFPWLLLGYSQTTVLPIAQFASVVGVFGMSALTAITAQNTLGVVAPCHLSGRTAGSRACRRRR